MGKVDVYFADYLTICEVTEDESALLGSNACIIGMPLILTYEASSGVFRVVDDLNRSLGLVEPDNKLRIREAIQEGWGAACWLSLVWFDNADNKFHGEVVYQYYNVKPSQTNERENLRAYTLKTSQRLAAGQRPDVNLTGAGWDAVLAEGDWQASTQQALPISTKRNSGTVILKRKRSLADRLFTNALMDNPVARWSVTIVLTVVVLVALIVFCVEVLN